MKNAKKIVMGGVAALALVTASVMGTMAYFTSKTETVNNTFTVGKVKITLDETKTNDLGEFVKKTGEKDESGNDIYTIVSKNEADRTMSNEYKMIPGKTYQKDPTITVADKSEDSYLFVKVEDELAGVEGEVTVNKQILVNWTPVDGEEGVYYYGKNNSMTVVHANDKVTLFNTVTINPSATKEDLKAVNGKTIKVTAYAVQAEGIDSVATAWKAAKEANTND